MKNHKWPGTKQLGTAALTLALGATFSSTAHAQREAPNRGEQRQERRERVEQMTPEQRQQYFQQRMQERLKNMTPEQRQQMEQRRRQMTEQREQSRWEWVRSTLVASGYTEATLQNAVIAFMQAQEKARLPLLDQARNLTVNLIKPETANDVFTTEVAAFREAVAKDKARYEAELAELDKKINFSTQPRLETLLTVLGVVGSEVPSIGGLSTVFPDSAGNRDGTGRMMGG